ncbi:hypothetical protein CEXT_208581 [Caerostris extrusa]|uniref:Uncharacterized protein n=1 Tax=Caerostris extrusa TaxID=172846 RepID=A0AAV4XGP9_CAEEX|nr:hypothetical protein CEXT_208581 [Caerostris extrusa]
MGPRLLRIRILPRPHFECLATQKSIFSEERRAPVPWALLTRRELDQWLMGLSKGFCKLNHFLKSSQHEIEGSFQCSKPFSVCFLRCLFLNLFT